MRGRERQTYLETHTQRVRREIQRQINSETHTDTERDRNTVRDTERPTYMQKLRGWLRKRGSVKGEGCGKHSKIVIERGHKGQTESEPANWTARPVRQR